MLSLKLSLTKNELTCRKMLGAAGQVELDPKKIKEKVSEAFELRHKCQVSWWCLVHRMLWKPLF